MSGHCHRTHVFMWGYCSLIFLGVLISSCDDNGKLPLVDTGTDTNSSTGDGDGDIDGDADSDGDADTDTDSDSGTEITTDTTVDSDTLSDTDTSCTDDLNCLPAQFCSDQTCIDDLCIPGQTQCSGNDVLTCASNGSGMVLLFSCDATPPFVSTCVQITPILAGCNCIDDWDCPAHTVCTVDICEGTGVEPTCSLPPQPFADMLPTSEIQWGGVDIANPNALNSPFPESAQTVMSPIVANLDDDNGDGKINELDFPEIIFTTFVGSSHTENGVLRAIHGGGPDKGKDYFAVCNDLVWHQGDDLALVCDYANADINSTASLAVGDLDYDGIPEIVAVLEGNDGGIAIYDNTGKPISKSGPLGMNYQNPGPTLANIDHLGFAEIIIGAHVFTLIKNDSNVLTVLEEFKEPVDSEFKGQGPATCVADLNGDGNLEIVLETTVYRMPASPPGVLTQAQCAGPYPEAEYTAFCAGQLVLVWDGATVNEGMANARGGFCAIADILGADEVAAPSPSNPPDDKPEVITVANGRLFVFNGATGLLLRQMDLYLEGADDAKGGGGAPNVDDFDGDGFVEVGCAMSTQYMMIDFQEPTALCPEWTIPFVDDVPGLQGNPERTGPCLHNGWRRATQDESSKVTGSSVFDFNGDKAAEVIYNDECYFRIYDGSTGAVLFKQNSPSRTRIEYPIVADVDNDGNAEIVFCTSNESGFCEQHGGPVGSDNYNNGLEVWGDATDGWVPARRIWNQHAYHVTNVTESAGIPVDEPAGWLTFGEREYNLYRSNPRAYGVAPDFTLTGMQISSPDASCGQLTTHADISVRIENIGDVQVGPGVVVAFFGEWDLAGISEPLHLAGGAPLEYTLINGVAPHGMLLATVSYDAENNSPLVLPDRIRAVVDFYDQERECDETNNELEAPVVTTQLGADLRISVGAIDPLTCPKPVVAATVFNDGNVDAANVVVRFYAGDPTAGGLVLLEVVIPAIAAGASVVLSETITEFSISGAVWIYGVVDPDNAIFECNDGNNSDKADNEIQCIIIIG